MANQQSLIKDFKITGGYLYTKPNRKLLQELEDYADENDEQWRYKAERLQKKRWRYIIKHSA